MCISINLFTVIFPIRSIIDPYRTCSSPDCGSTAGSSSWSSSARSASTIGYFFQLINLIIWINYRFVCRASSSCPSRRYTRTCAPRLELLVDLWSLVSNRQATTVQFLELFRFFLADDGSGKIKRREHCYDHFIERFPLKMMMTCIVVESTGRGEARAARHHQQFCAQGAPDRRDVAPPPYDEATAVSSFPIPPFPPYYNNHCTPSPSAFPPSSVKICEESEDLKSCFVPRFPLFNK